MISSKLACDLKYKGRGQIDYILDHFRQQYEMPSQTRMLDSLEQVTAGVLGRIYGEVYASCFLKNKLNSRLESFMAPFFHRV